MGRSFACGLPIKRDHAQSLVKSRCNHWLTNFQVQLVACNRATGYNKVDLRERKGEANDHWGKIQSLRKQQGLSQEELADKLGISRQAVSKWEAEQSVPEPDNLLQLSSIFVVSTDMLIDEGRGMDEEATLEPSIGKAQQEEARENHGKMGAGTPGKNDIWLPFGPGRGSGWPSHRVPRLVCQPVNLGSLDWVDSPAVQSCRF